MKSRLKKIAWLEGYDKERKAAIVYINGKVYEAPNHAGAICEYYEDGNEENKYGNEVAVGYIKSDGNIYLALDALQNISRSKIDKVLSAIKEKYPNSEIYQDSFYFENDSNNGTRLAKLKKMAMDYGDRDFAIAYIDGEVVSARTHANCINEYLLKKIHECMWAVRRRPNINDDQFSKLDTDVVDDIYSEDYLTENQKEDLKMIRDNIKQIAFAHAVDGSNENSGYTEEEDGKHIYIERDTLYNVDFNTVVSAIKQAYPDYDIHVEETEEKVARLKYKRNITASSAYMSLNSIVLKSGDLIDFQVKIIANRPWFQIIHESQFNVSSYYDGPDFETACDFYKELLLAFYGVKKAESLKNLIPEFERKIERIKDENKNYNFQDSYQALKRQPLFLGINDF